MSKQDEKPDRMPEERRHTIHEPNAAEILPPRNLEQDILTRLGLAKEPVARLSGWTTSQLLRQLSMTSDWRERAWIVQCLPERGEKAQVEKIIIAYLQDDHEAVRMAAVRALGKLWQSGPMRLAPFLTALADSHPSVRATTIQVLASLKRQDLTGKVIEILKKRLAEKEEDEIVYIAIIQLLATLGKDAPVQLLLAVSQDHHADPLVRESAILALGSLRKYITPEQLSQALYDDDRFVREAAIFVLGTRAPINTLLHDLQKDTDVARQAKAARALGELNRPTRVIVDALYQAATDRKKSSSVRVASLLALAQLGAAMNEHTLAALQQVNDDDIRSAAEILADVLEQQGKPTRLVDDDEGKDTEGFHRRWVHEKNREREKEK